MSAPLAAELCSALRRLTFIKNTNVPALLCVQKLQSNQDISFSSMVWPKNGENNALISHTSFLSTESCTINVSRHYGHKRIQKPPKITYFQYSGDLRKIPEIDKDTLLYPYQGLEDEIKDNEVVKKLLSFQYATDAEMTYHKSQVVLDRIVELFGPDSELEQEIALLTLKIREKIPYCIANRTDKLSKIWLLKSIFRRRRLLTRLREIDHERLEWLLRELKIQYVLPKDREEYKGWKYNLRMKTQAEATAQQRQKLEKLKEKFEVEKKDFFERKAKVLAEIQGDLEKFGLSRDFLDQLQVVEKQEPVKEIKVKDEDDDPPVQAKKKK